MAASFTGVGVGPGDPELVTVAALRVLRAADRVFAPATAATEAGRAESIVGHAAPDVAIERLVFAIEGGEEERAGAHGHATDRVVSCLDAGEEVAFVTLGDPNVYSTFHHLACLVAAARPSVAIATVPGIMAFQALAARTGTVVVDGRQRLSIVTALDGLDVMDAALADRGSAVVVYKGGRHLPAIAGRLAELDRLDGAVFGELLGLSGERVGAVRDAAGAPATYLASVIVPAAASS